MGPHPSRELLRIMRRAAAGGQWFGPDVVEPGQRPCRPGLQPLALGHDPRAAHEFAELMRQAIGREALERGPERHRAI